MDIKTGQVSEQLKNISGENFNSDSATKIEMEKSEKTFDDSSKMNSRGFLKELFVKIHQGSDWIWKDLKQPHLAWVKIIFLLQSASLVTLYPYLIVHLRSLGFNIEDAAIVNTAVPLADIVAPPVAGLLADMLGNFRLFMAGITFLNGASSLLLLTVDSVHEKNSTMELCCSENGRFCHAGDINVDTVDGIFLSCFSETETQFHAQLISGIANVGSCEKSNCSLPTSNNTIKAKAFSGKSSNLMKPAFWHYVGVRVVLDVFRASSLMLFEGAVVAIIKQHGGDYGLQKLFGTLGAVVFGPLAGQLIDVQQRDDLQKPADAYTAVILLYFCLRTITAACLLKVNLGFKHPAKKVVKNVWYVLRKTEVFAFLLAFLVSGILWGFLENFLFWLLEDLGATKFLMGISLAIGTLAGVPLTVFSGLIVKKLGHRNLMLLALLLYTVRITGYSLLTQPELFLLFESLKPFCTTLLLIGTFSFIKNNSSVTVAATMESIFGAAYFGVGRGIGGLIGGFAIYDLGAPLTFQVVATLSAATAVVYTILTEVRRRWGSRTYTLPQL